MKSTKERNKYQLSPQKPKPPPNLQDTANLQSPTNKPKNPIVINTDKQNNNATDKQHNNPNNQIIDFSNISEIKQNTARVGKDSFYSNNSNTSHKSRNGIDFYKKTNNSGVSFSRILKQTQNNKAVNNKSRLSNLTYDSFLKAQNARPTDKEVLSELGSSKKDNIDKNISISIYKSDLETYRSQEKDKEKEQKIKDLIKKSNNNNNDYKYKLINNTTQICNGINFNERKLKLSKIYEFKNHLEYSNFELSKLVYDVFESAPENSLLILPPRFISLPHIRIQNSIKIRGSTGTLIEINNGNIIVMNNNTSNNEIIINIRECSIVFNLEISSFLDRYQNDEFLTNNNVEVFNGRYHIALIKLNNTHLEMLDCDVRSIVHENGTILEAHDKNRVINETCISFNKSPNSNTAKSSIALMSMVLLNFYKCIELNNISKILIADSHFLNCINDAVIIVNSFNIEFVTNLINYCMSGIKIIYLHTGDEDEVSNSAIKNDSHINIKGNEFTNCSSQGINISSNINYGIDHFNLEARIKKLYINITKNKLTFCKASAVLIENILLTHLDILENFINLNFDYGIFINNIQFINDKAINLDSIKENLKAFDNENSFANPEICEMINFIFSKNHLSENKNNAAIKFYLITNCRLMMTDSNLTENLYGLVFSNTDGLIFINNCEIVNNMDDGISISENGSIMFLFNNVKILNNNNYGVNLKQWDLITRHTTCESENSSSTNHNSKKSDRLNEKLIPNILFRECQFNYNKSGILLSNYALTLNTCEFKNNNNWAVEIPDEKNKLNLKILNKNQSSNGIIAWMHSIGGNWGSISSEKCTGCSTNTKCSIF